MSNFSLQITQKVIISTFEALKAPQVHPCQVWNQSVHPIRFDSIRFDSILFNSIPFNPFDSIHLNQSILICFNGKLPSLWTFIAFFENVQHLANFKEIFMFKISSQISNSLASESVSLLRYPGPVLDHFQAEKRTFSTFPVNYHVKFWSQKDQKRLFSSVFSVFSFQGHFFDLFCFQTRWGPSRSIPEQFPIHFGPFSGHFRPFWVRKFSRFHFFMSNFDLQSSKFWSQRPSTCDSTIDINLFGQFNSIQKSILICLFWSVQLIHRFSLRTFNTVNGP